MFSQRRRNNKASIYSSYSGGNTKSLNTKFGFTWFCLKEMLLFSLCERSRIFTHKSCLTLKCQHKTVKSHTHNGGSESLNFLFSCVIVHRVTQDNSMTGCELHWVLSQNDLSTKLISDAITYHLTTNKNLSRSMSPDTRLLSTHTEVFWNTCLAHDLGMETTQNCCSLYKVTNLHLKGNLKNRHTKKKTYICIHVDKASKKHENKRTTKYTDFNWLA